MAAAAYAIAAFAAPFGLLPRLAPPSFLARCFAAWLFTALILFFLDDQLSVLALAGFAILLLAPTAPVLRIAFFLVTAPCLPAYLQVYLPFPGINWLVMLTYYKVLVFFVLLPLLFQGMSRRESSGTFSAADACVVAYVGLSVVMVTASMGITAGPRFLIDQLLVLAVPYFVLSRLIRNPGDLDLCFRAILLASLILAAIAIMATLKQWDFYRFKEPPSVFLIPDVRSGLMRIAGTANTHSLGYHLAIGILVLEYLKKRLALGFLRLWLFRAMLLAGLLSTDSRGALLALLVAFLTYGIISIRSAGARRTMLASLVVVVVGTGLWLITTDDASSVDAYNSVGYRQLLLQVSVDHILSNPLFGDLHFMSDPKFSLLRQGQGIIDITNFYLQIALSFGLVGLALLIGIFAPTLFRLVGFVGALAANEEHAETRRMATIIISALVGWFVLVATTSDIALTFHLGLTLVALGRAITRFPHLQPKMTEKPVASAHGQLFRHRPGRAGNLCLKGKELPVAPHACG